jgi:hypothetical protein
MRQRPHTHAGRRGEGDWYTLVENVGSWNVLVELQCDTNVRLWRIKRGRRRGPHNLRAERPEYVHLSPHGHHCEQVDGANEDAMVVVE